MYERTRHPDNKPPRRWVACTLAEEFSHLCALDQAPSPEKAPSRLSICVGPKTLPETNKGDESHKEHLKNYTYGFQSSSTRLHCRFAACWTNTYTLDTSTLTPFFGEGGGELERATCV